ncbi:MAG: DevR family CRISPR-associated autoregulator [Candidatus Bathyarchaeota archaeon]|nr:DevR family CRISPR-associated autoregulator [Candidatus Termiticorpusculum sp.]
MSSKILTHIAGTFLVEASASFLNGAGLGDGENRNVTLPKTFRDGRDRVPYVSSQAWRRWLRNTLIEETNWPASVLRPLDLSEKGTTNKIGGEFDPINYPEDDIFGYMRAEAKQKPRIDVEDSENDATDVVKEKGQPVKPVIRASPFSTSILCSIRKSGWQGRDEGFVHLKEGTPLPYTTEFYNTHLEGIFSLNYMRLGVFWNIGDRVELDEAKTCKLLTDGKIKIVKEEKSGKVYEVTDVAVKRKERASAVLNALAHLRGGAKQAAFGTDVAPKALILAGVSCGNPMLNSLFVDDGSGPCLKIDTLKEIAKDYADRIVTPIFIGIRKGYLKNESDVLQLQNVVDIGVTFKVLTPIESAQEMAMVLT